MKVTSPGALVSAGGTGPMADSIRLPTAGSRVGRAVKACQAALADVGP